MTYLPTSKSSKSEGLFRNLVQTSIVNIVEDELNIDVRDDIKAAIITANINPRIPKIHIYIHGLGRVSAASKY